jgi:hypothetical protein
MTAYSTGKSTEMVQREITTLVKDAFESSDLESTLIDVDRITFLRDPAAGSAAVSDTTEEPTIVSTTITPAEPTADAPSAMDPGGDDGSSTATLVPTLESSFSTSSSEPVKTIVVPDEKPLILRFPLWGWACVLVGIFLLWGLKFLIDRLIESRSK